MNKTNKILVGVIVLLAVLLVAVGYAAISAVNLNITGDITATPSDENFKVKFTGTPTQVAGSKGTVTPSITGDLAARMDVSGLTAAGDTASATFDIVNDSPDLSALLSVESETASNTTYFKVTHSFDKTEITKKGSANDTAKITVTVELIKTPVEDNVSATIDVKIKADPQQP